MLIRLLPIPPHPSVLFNINFEDLPDGLSLPPTWTAHLSNIMHDELPMPRWQHALDKATFLPCILDEVIFDIPALLVTCRFIDGTIEEWKINLGGLANKCLKTLESVVDDVCLSTLETERERQREKQREQERERERESERLRLLRLTSPSSSFKSTKHKKKRSLLMTIVSGLSSLNSIINLSLPSPTVSMLASPSTPPLPKSTLSSSQPTFEPVIPPPQEICPRFLRRRARSSLVDAFRLYVLHELNQRVSQGGYYVWALHSLLNEARQRQEEFLARERELEREHERERERERLKLLGPPPPYVPLTPPGSRSASSLSSSSTGSSSLILFGRRRQNLKRDRRPSNEIETFSATTSCEPPTSDDEEEVDSVTTRGHTQERGDETDGDTETIDTDTDGSSIQTPTSEHFDLPLPSGLPSAVASQDLPSLLDTRPVSNQLDLYSPLPNPNSMHFQIQSLTQLILLHNSHSARMVHDDNTRLDALEVRGKRRAWLNRALCPNGIRLKFSDLQKMEIGIGASHSGLGFSVPTRRSALGIWVVNAEDVECEEISPMGSESTGLGQIDAIMLEDDVELVGGERFTGYDERNGIEPKRFKISVPSHGVQLLPVNEVEEDDDLESNQAAPYVPSKPLCSTEHGDDEFAGLNLNQYDDLRELQMDLDIVTGVGFDMMDSSDEEEGAESHLNIGVPHAQGEATIPEGGIRVAFDIPRPKALHARSSHFLSGEKQRQRQRVLGVSCDQEHHVHQYSHPDTLPERCHTPIPFSRPLGLGPESVDVITPVSTSPAPVSSIPVPQPVYFRTSPAISSEYAAAVPKKPNNPISVRATVKESFEIPFRPPSRAASRDPESDFCASTGGPESSPIPYDVSVNEMGELVAGMEVMGLGEDDGEEFTLAMDLPSKLLRFNGVSFAAVGQTRAFKGRARGATKLRGPHDVTNPEGMSVVVEEVEGDTAWV